MALLIFAQRPDLCWPSWKGGENIKSEEEIIRRTEDDGNCYWAAAAEEQEEGTDGRKDRVSHAELNTPGAGNQTVRDWCAGRELARNNIHTEHTHTMHFRAPCHRRQEGKSFDPENIYIYPVIQIVLLVSASLQLSRKRSKRERDGYPWWKKKGRNEADESRPRDPATDEPIRLSFLPSLARRWMCGRRVPSFPFFFLPSFASFVSFPSAVANGTVGKKKKKVCGEGRRKDVGVVCWVNPGGDVFALEWLWNESVVVLLLSLSSPWWARGIESVRRAWREKEKRVEGGLLLRRRLQGPTREWGIESLAGSVCAAPVQRVALIFSAWMALGRRAEQVE